MNIIGKALKGLSPLFMTKNSAIILTFHRVLKHRDSLQPSIITEKEFYDVVEYVSQIFHVLSLAELISDIKNKKIKKGSVVFTFDDGYADNCEIAMPILKKFNCSGTFFIATGFLDGGKMWNDTLVECIRHAPSPELNLTSLGLDIYDVSHDKAKIQTINSVIIGIKHKAPERRAAIVSELVKITGLSLLPNLMMSTIQVKKMQDEGMEIGAHTVSHPILSSVTDEVAYAEIHESRQKLASILAQDINVFAYPNGKPNIDFHERDINIVRSEGFTGAVSTHPGIVNETDDVFQLSRWTPWDKTGFKFSLRLLMKRIPDYP